MNRTIAIVNRKGGSGKTVSTFNLAGALSEAGRKVLTIDLDPQGSLTKGWGLTPGPAKLSQILIEGGEGFEQLIQKTNIDNLWAIAADPDLNAIESGLREVPGRELRLRRCLHRFFTGEFDYILLDSAPLPNFAEARVLCKRVDGVVLVIESGKIRRQVALRAKKELEDAGAHILGVVLNKRKYHIPEWLYKRL